MERPKQNSSKYLHALTGRDRHIFSLRCIIIIVMLILIFAIWGWKSSPDKLTIHIPPDLRSGSTRIWWEVDPANIYSFAFYIFQQLNNWPKDGEVDFKRNINQLSAFLTPQCQEILNTEYVQRRNLGEIKGRVRSIGEISGRGINSKIRNNKTGAFEDRVNVLSKDAWIVTFDIYADEYYSGEAVKRSLVRYPLSVVRSDSDPEANPWGLRLNCYANKPLKLMVGDNND